MHAKSTMNARLALHQLMGLSSSASSTGTESNQILSAARDLGSKADELRKLAEGFSTAHRAA